MLTLERFTGINNVVPTERLMPDKKTGLTPLASAMNVDIGLDRELQRRGGYTQENAICHKNLWQGLGFQLATVDGDLTAIAANGDRTVIYPSLGVSRVWYGNLPDGRTTFSNGLINGITDGASRTTWGPPLPESIGTPTDIAGGLDAGDYRYSLTNVRTSDGLEGGPLYSLPFTIADGGLMLTALPQIAGHTINVYITTANGDTGFLAGNASSSVFTFTGANEDLQLACPTEWLAPMPVGTVTAFWRGRALVAKGADLCASMANRWELFDPRKDAKRFSADITLIQPVAGGIFVGTAQELVFLAGDKFDDLVSYRRVAGPVVLGSGVTVPGKLLRRGQGLAGQDDCMVCIADRILTAGYSDGGIEALTQGQYATSATEVAATFREIRGIPQYIAIEQ
jgi:hypothetical protein